MAEEPFPNADELLQQAFTTEDPVPQLLQVIKKSPTLLGVRYLTTAYTCAISEEPFRAHSIASSFVRLCESPDAAVFKSDTLRSLVDEELMDGYFRVCENYINPKESDKYEPENIFLLEALVAGVSVKHGWNSSTAQYSCLRDALDAPAGPGISKSEVLVMGACIQLLLKGSIFVGDIAGSYRKTPAEIEEKLKKHRDGGTVADSRAIAVLEMAILHAEQGLKPENDRGDVWELLFPKNS